MQRSIISVVSIHNVPANRLVTDLNIVKRLVKKNLKANKMIVTDKHFTFVFSFESVWENNQSFSFLIEVIFEIWSN